MTGVYAILNKKNGNQYIGSAVNIAKRWHAHRCTLRKGKHKNRQLQAAWNLDGEGSFDFRIITLCSEGELLVWEQAAMEQQDCSYNIAPTAGTTAGVKNTPETIAKMKAAKANVSDATREKIRQSMLGHVTSEETKRKISEATKGRKLSPEQVAKRRGKKASIATREKIRQARRRTYLTKNRLFVSNDKENA